MEERIDNSDRSLIKGISLFGGVQIFQVLISVIRGKFVALLLGPDGMGINTLFNSAQNTVQIFGSLGLNLAIVREISANRDNEEKFSKTVAVALRLIFRSAVFGAFICFALAPLLSLVTFGTYNQTVSFLALSLSLFFSIAAAGKLSVLQGLHQVRRISRSSLVSAIVGLVVGVPLYWLFGTDGIVPAIIGMSASMYFFYSYTLKKCKVPYQESIKLGDHKPLIKKLLSIGLILVIGNFVTTGCTYCINLFVRTIGNINDVGLFQAANSITMQYIGVVFSAMAVDYLPRLSRNITDNTYVSDLANRQISLLSYIVSPIVCGLILTAPILIRFLLTPEFEEITELIRWMGVGVMLRAINYPLGYITFAKNNKRVYMGVEVIFYNIVNLTLSFTGYYYFGLIGLGAAIIANGVIGIVTDYILQRKLYSFRFTKSTIMSLITAIAFTITVFLVSYLESFVSYYIMTALFLGSLSVSILKIRAGIKKG